ncbi:MAG TPA: (2Fe-2S) ferredoxin domain-containing protein [Pseudoflavonifractor sp.]|jgi:NADH:ubiquinone oxidoreductase subunit E|nr:(2Fe-2S) ferredoxin domain-containing protein [Pseudoflavonifractor sp.]
MVTLSVCIGSSCHLKGSYNVVQTFQQMIEEYALGDDVLQLKGSFCMKQCQNRGVGVMVDDAVHSVRPEEARAFFRDTILPLVGK